MLKNKGLHVIFQAIFSSSAKSLSIQGASILLSILFGWIVAFLTQKQIGLKKNLKESNLSKFLLLLGSSFALLFLLPLMRFFIKEKPYLLHLALSTFIPLTIWKLWASFFKNRMMRIGGMILIWSSAFLHAVGLLIPIMNYLRSITFHLGSISISLLGLLKAFFSTGFLIYGAMIFSSYLASKLRRQRHIQLSIQLLIAKVVKTLLIICSTFIGLSLLGIDLSVFSIFAGALGVGLAFSLQHIFSNYFSGFVILLDRSIKPGDVISIHEEKTYGIVTKLHARYVSVRTREGKEYLIPNQMIITNRLENWSYSDPYIRIEIPFVISTDSDLLLAKELLLSIANKTDRVKRDPPPCVRFSALVHNGVHVKLRLWVIDPENGTSEIQSDIIYEVWKAFKEAGIRIPYPPREMYPASFSEQGERLEHGYHAHSKVPLDAIFKDEISR